MYEGDAFVVLEPDQPEQFLAPAELLEKLKAVLTEMQDDLPHELRGIDSITDQAKHLLENSCELDVGRDRYLQWYVVRLEK
jgi:hypothetical protein